MRFARYVYGGRETYGIVEGDRLIDIDGDLFKGWTRTERSRPLADAKLLPPVEPRTFYAAGLNYADHVLSASKITGKPASLPEKPDIGYRANNALVGQGDAIVVPKDATEKVQYEGELVAVIGKQARNVPQDKALDYVFGWTIGNDVSERTWQRGDRTFWRGKNCDTFKPMGPWIETEVDLDKLETIVRVNGRQTIRFPTNHMIFGVARYISAMSRYLTLYPGDVVWMGTEGEAENIKPGDVVEVEIPGIGVLRNPVVAGA
jgi:2-keto-4-pentenoate hydratase/2-oxohepta-3-ene-1,7-dioic acid hydratase in catechol pathway